MDFAYQLQINFPEAITPEDFTGQLPNHEPSFPKTLNSFTDSTSNLDSLYTKLNLLKGLMQQMSHTFFSTKGSGIH